MGSWLSWVWTKHRTIISKLWPSMSLCTPAISLCNVKSKQLIPYRVKIWKEEVHWTAAWSRNERSRRKADSVRNQTLTKIKAQINHLMFPLTRKKKFPRFQNHNRTNTTSTLMSISARQTHRYCWLWHRITCYFMKTKRETKFCSGSTSKTCFTSWARKMCSKSPWQWNAN